MRRNEAGSGFDFNNDQVVDEQVGLIFPDNHTVKVDGNENLLFDLQTKFSPTMGYCILVYLFQKPITELFVDFAEAGNHLLSQRRMFAFKLCPTHDLSPSPPFSVFIRVCPCPML